ncbi:MAG: tRNA (adenosine(37)-N6)-threonylcarbamoyltransferase complex dimerization subunit type 1 TsaB [Chromatiales bacterium]
MKPVLVWHTVAIGNSGSGTMSLKILAIDTSTEACSAALLLGDEVRERFEIAPRRHSELILRMIDELFREAGLTLTSLAGLAFGRGPGSFTGVRIASGVIQGLALGADLGVAPISTLAALAQGAHRQTGSRQVLSVIDARMGEVYWGIYELDASGIMCATQPECVARPAAVPFPETGTWFGVGSGWSDHGEALRQRLGERLRGADPHRYPSARDIALLGAQAFRRGDIVAAEQALPVYLRDLVAEPKG